MQVLMKIAITVIVVLAATAVGKRYPSAAGLIGVMPLTGALVLLWMYFENSGDSLIMENFTRGALWGILPSILFFLTALVCFRKEFPLAIVLVSSFAMWAAAAVVHQWALK